MLCRPLDNFGFWNNLNKLNVSCCYCCSVAQSCLTLCNPMNCTMPGSSVLQYLMEFAQTHVHWVNDAIQPSHPLPPALNLSHHQGLFQWVGSSHQVTKVLELQFQHQSFNEHSELISFRIDWFDLLAVQGILKSLLWYHSSKSSILQCSTFFMALTSIHDYWKNHSFDYMDLCLWFLICCLDWSLVGCSPWGCKGLDKTERLRTA